MFVILLMPMKSQNRVCGVILVAAAGCDVSPTAVASRNSTLFVHNITRRRLSSVGGGGGQQTHMTVCFLMRRLAVMKLIARVRVWCEGFRPYRFWQRSLTA